VYNSAVFLNATISLTLAIFECYSTFSHASHHHKKKPEWMRAQERWAAERKKEREAMTPEERAACAYFLEENNLQKLKSDPGARIKVSKGFESLQLSHYAKEFLLFTGESPNTVVLDIGCGVGIVSRAALDWGCTVVANEIDIGLLNLLNIRAGDKRERLSTALGPFPDVNIKPNHFGAIYAGAIFHFFDDVTITRGLKACFDALVPGGKLFVTVATKFLGGKLTGLHGFIPNLREIDSKLYETYGPTLNLLEMKDWERFFMEAGFVVEGEKRGYFVPEGFPEELKLDGNEYLGIVGRKRLITRHRPGPSSNFESADLPR